MSRHPTSKPNVVTKAPVHKVPVPVHPTRKPHPKPRTKAPVGKDSVRLDMHLKMANSVPGKRKIKAQQSVEIDEKK